MTVIQKKNEISYMWVLYTDLIVRALIRISSSALGQTLVSHHVFRMETVLDILSIPLSGVYVSTWGILMNIFLVFF